MFSRNVPQYDCIHLSVGNNHTYNVASSKSAVLRDCPRLISALMSRVVNALPPRYLICTCTHTATNTHTHTPGPGPGIHCHVGHVFLVERDGDERRHERW